MDQNYAADVSHPHFTREHFRSSTQSQALPPSLDLKVTKEPKTRPRAWDGLKTSSKAPAQATNNIGCFSGILGIEALAGQHLGYPVLHALGGGHCEVPVHLSQQQDEGRVQPDCLLDIAMQHFHVVQSLHADRPAMLRNDAPLLFYRRIVRLFLHMRVRLGCMCLIHSFNCDLSCTSGLHNC